MQSIAFHILKGGVGKTSLSGNIAYALSRKEKTLLVDCDIQSNASRWFFPNEAKWELADVLQAKCDVEEALVGLSNKFLLLPTKSKNSSLKTYSETQLFNEPFIFEDLLSELNKLTFKHVVFDLSPSISQLERCVLLAIDEVVTPLTPEYFSYDGIELFHSELQKINKSYRKSVRHKKIVINSINLSFATHQAYLGELERLKHYDLYRVPQDRKVADSQIHHKSIFEYEPRSKVIPELNRLAEGFGSVRKGA